MAPASGTPPAKKLGVLATRLHVPGAGPRPHRLPDTPLTLGSLKLSPQPRLQATSASPPCPYSSPAPAIRAPGLPRPADCFRGAGAGSCAMTWAGVRGDGPRPCYSAERRRPDDAAGSAEPRATLGSGRGDSPDGASPAGGLSCRRSLRCGVSAAGAAGPGRPAAPPCLCYCAAAAAAASPQP